jgi:hypothetical protein
MRLLTRISFSQCVPNNGQAHTGAPEAGWTIREADLITRAVRGPGVVTFRGGAWQDDFTCIAALRYNTSQEIATAQLLEDQPGRFVLVGNRDGIVNV